MNLLDFIFRLGVVFAIYGFLWGIFDIGIKLIASGRKRSISEVYLFKAVKYFFLVDVTFLFCLESLNSEMIILNQVIFAGIILLTYFIGKLQQNQNKRMLFNFATNGLPMQDNTFHLKKEIAVITIALSAFVLFWFYPYIASNPISIWFHESIINIEDTPIFGFIFKVIGFFFLLNLIFKMLGAITFILNGGKIGNRVNSNRRNEQEDNHFDDYTEIN
ncbi:MAG: hypothetical protein MK105_11385 [Crocinitomicaceae bacterium]|nr:hypothetical protein [Crocinitomicaceae bacterium]